MIKSLNQPNPPIDENTASHVPMRRCIVSGESYPREGLLRFVASPDGVIVFDLKKNLPGRGIWVSPQRSILEQAIEKGTFTRGAKQKVAAPQDLPEKVEAAIKQRLASLVQRGVGSKSLVTGYEKCASALRGTDAEVVIHASDASDDGKNKLNRLAEERVKVIEPFTRDELAEILNLPNPVHLVLSSKQLAKAMIKEYNLWAGFIGIDTV